MKVAIVGTVPVSRVLAPYEDQSWEIWPCSPGNRGQIPRVTKWFELHAIVSLRAPENAQWAQPYFAFLNEGQFPVYMQEKNDLVKQATVFPRDRLLEKFGRNWFTSSVAWMMAFAIDQMGPGDEIGIFGVDMAANEEHYSAQRAGCVHFIELAKAKGIKVSIPMESCLGMGTPLYGYDQASRFGRKLYVREMECRNQIANLEGQLQRIRDELNYMRGALEDIQYTRRTFIDGMDDAELDFEIIEAKPQPEAVAKSTDQIAAESAHDAFVESTGKVLVPANKATGKPRANGASEARRGADLGIAAA